MTNHLPFPALVGLETAQQALLLLAVEPRLRGVVLAAPAGTGKSSLARGLRGLLKERDTPFVELPANADIDNLLGGLDLEATLLCGWPVVRPGILARAHNGIAYVDGINLLTDASANLLLAVLDEGEVRVEREGASLRAPARFSLIGAYDPAEGAPRNHLLDRVGLLATLPGNAEAAQRSEVIRRNLKLKPEAWADDLDLIYGLVQAAREQLPAVIIHPEQIEGLSRLSLLYGVQGHRVDLFAVYAACAAAALALRDTVEDEDLEVAARLVILPRATRIPPPPSEAAPPPPAQDQPAPTSEMEEEAEQDEEAPPTPPGPSTEQLLSALASELPETLEDLPFRNLRRGRSGSRGSTDAKRGRHVRSLPGDPRRHRIDAAATLRAAAPWQRVRRATDRRSPFPKGANERAVVVRFGDVRVKHLRSKAGALFCFAVDASGSMAIHRMRQAKGAMHTLLQKAYINRDRVALIAFRGAKAELLMPPTQSVELARRALDRLPTGGGTPLASALLLACDVARQARQRGILQTVLILLTDGRANVGLQAGGDLQAELEQLGRHIIAAGIHTVVVDTQRSYLSQGQARRLAGWLGGEYAYLPQASGEQIADLAAQAI